MNPESAALIERARRARDETAWLLSQLARQFALTARLRGQYAQLAGEFMGPPARPGPVSG